MCTELVELFDLHKIKGKTKPKAGQRMFLEDTIMLETGEVAENPELYDPENGRINSDLQYNEFVVYDVGQVSNPK